MPKKNTNTASLIPIAARQRKTQLSPETNFLFSLPRRKNLLAATVKTLSVIVQKFLNIYARCSGSQQVEIASLSVANVEVFSRSFPRSETEEESKKRRIVGSSSFKSHYENKASYNKLFVKSLLFAYYESGLSRRYYVSLVCIERFFILLVEFITKEILLK